MVKATKPWPEPDGSFREIEHTGDLAIEVVAATRGGLFRSAALALAALMVNPAKVEARERRQLVIEAAAAPDLMHELLSRLLEVFLLDAFIWAEAGVEETASGLRVTLDGEPFDASRHEFSGEIKAVTYHGLVVEEWAGGWRARVVFDV